MHARQQVARLLVFVTAAAGIATLLAYGGRWSWFCELLVNFRTHYAMALGVALIVAAIMRRWRIGSVAALALVLNLWPMSRVYFGVTPPAPQARAVRVVAFNVNIGNDDMARVARYLESLSPDVVILEELPRENADRLFALLPTLPHRFHVVDLSAGGLAIVSRTPMSDAAIVRREGLAIAARADVDLGDRRLRVHGIHLYWPLVPASALFRDAQLRALARELRDCVGACMAAGDFNTTPWSSHFRDLLAESGFQDCAQGQGWAPTWPAGLPAPLRIRIDQCLAGPGVSVVRVAVGRSAGSDHLATINDLAVVSPHQ